MISTSTESLTISRVWQYRIIGIAALLFITIPLLRHGQSQRVPLLNTKAAQGASDNLYEGNIALPSSTGPFTCSVKDLPRKIRMTAWQAENYVVLSHGMSDIVSDGMWGGGWEPWILTRMKNYMSAIRTLDGDRDVYLDLGANIGAHTLPMMGAGYGVHAFEPTPLNEVLLRCSLAWSGATDRVRLNAFGLGEEVMQVCMQTSAGNAGDTRVKETAECGPSAKALIGTVDNYYEKVLRGKQKIAVMKIDIQGSEIGALRRSTAFFDSAEAPAVVFFEYELDIIKDRGYDPIELVQFFYDRDFELYQMFGTSKIMPVDFSTLGVAAAKKGRGEDIVAVKREWKARLEAAGHIFNGSELVGKKPVALGNAQPVVEKNKPAGAALDLLPP